MDKESLIQKLEERLEILRTQLDKHDGSALSAMAEGLRTGFESAKRGLENLKGAIMAQDAARKTLDSLKEHMDTLERAVKEGDKKMSAKLLDMMEKTIRDLKEKRDE